MNNVIAFGVAIALFWLLLNIAVKVGLLKLTKGRVEVRYGIFLLVEVNRPSKPRFVKYSRHLFVFSLLSYIIALVFASYALASSLLFRFRTGERGMVLLIPGFNVAGEDLLLFLLAIVVAVGLHEYMHAKFATNLGVSTKSWGFLLAVILPAAFVELDEQSFNTSSKATKISILSAGIVSNLALTMLAFVLIQVVANPYGLVVTAIEPGGLADEAGIKPYDVIFKINGEDATLEYLRSKLQGSDSPELVITIYRKGVGLKEVIVYRTGNETKLGVSLFPVAPSKVIMEIIDPALFLYLFRALTWLYIVNFSLMFLNALPLFVTDGGRIVEEILGRKGRFINVLVTALLVYTLIVGARV